MVEEAWDNIEAELEKDPQKKGFWYFGLRAAAVAAIISFGVVTLWLLNRDVPETRLAEEPRITSPPPADTGSAAQAGEQPPLADPIQDPATKLAALPALVSDPQDTQPIAEPGDSIAPQHPPSPGGPLTAALASFPETLTPRPIQPPVYGDAYLAKQSSLKKPVSMDVDELALQEVADAFTNNIHAPGSFSLGITAAIKNTWLINNETFEGFNRLNHNRTDLRFLPDIGINLHFQYTRRWGIEAGLFFSSSTGQTYRQYIHGKYTQRSITLNYLQWELMASHTTGKQAFQNSNTVSLKSSLGLYASAMNSATETIENERSDVAPLYSGFDYGMLMGQYLQWQPARKIVFSPGIHLKWGLTDIYQGGTDLSSFSNTYNRSIEFRLNIYYTPGR